MRSVAFVVALVACLHAAAWAIWESQSSAPNISGPLASVSYSPFEGSAHPDDPNNRVSIDKIRSDLRVLSPLTRAIRTYSSTGGVELVTPVAAEFGLKVAVGAWVDKDEKRNARELRAAVDLVRKNRNVNALVVGNETIFRGEQSADDLIRLIHQTKREVGGAVPVTTGEIWHVWIEHPELASAVDFIAAHVLPYWEGFSETQAADQAVIIYNRLREAFPGKRIVIAEFGWPSAGYNRKAAEPGRIEQAAVLRNFVARAEAVGIDYNIIEAFDQPWKSFEGSVGAYWGLFDAERQPKFSWTGIIGNSDHSKIGAIAIAVGILMSLPILAIAGATIMQALTLAVFAHVVGAWAAVVFDYKRAAEIAAGRALTEPWGQLEGVALAGRPCFLMPGPYAPQGEVDAGLNFLRNLAAALPA